jgi:hypothetical protein
MTTALGEALDAFILICTHCPVVEALHRDGA